MRVNPAAPVLATLALLVINVVPAQAAFPGANGRLAFQAELPAGDHTQTDVYTMRPNGSGVTALTSTPDLNEFGPGWDAAGMRITFWRTPAPFGPGSVWVMDGDGGNQRQLTSDIDARDPVWNPAGTRIAFTSTAAGTFDIWTMRSSDGGGRHRVTSGAALDFEPAWSPDGTRIAFTRGFQQGDVGDVYVIDLRTGAITQVTNSPDYDHQVAWSPGGDRLVFERDFPSAFSIFTVDPDGSRLTRLTDGPFLDNGPAFSPDGRLIAFGSDRGGAALGDVWVMNADGTDPHSVRELRFSQGFPDWQPLG